MTIAISIKVNDGVVLATDMVQTPQGVGVGNIYLYADKIFNLYKGYPIGAITWGAGNIGQASIATLAKDFRKKIKNEGDYSVNPKSYTIKDVAEKFKKFVYDDNYVKEFRDWPQKPALGFMIVGYSSEIALAEEWKIDIINGVCTGPYLLRNLPDSGITWNGQTEAIFRLFLGFGTGLASVLKEAGIEDSKIETAMILLNQNQKLMAPMVMPPMPIQDTIDLAKFFVETTAQFTKFSLGPPTVGGPIEVAVVTKHEGFKWINRKHYFNTAFNPKDSKEE